MEINTDKLVDILKNDKPLSVMAVEENGKDKLICLFALPHLADTITEFANKLLKESETKKKQAMIRLEYYNGKEWILVGEYQNELIAWVTLGGDNFNHRTVDENGIVLTDKR